MSKIGIKLFNMLLSVSLLLSITGCQSEKQDSPVVESIPQKEETNVYIHYKLCDSSIYDPNTKELFAGGARFEMDEELNIFNLEIFVDVPIEIE